MLTEGFRRNAIAISKGESKFDAFDAKGWTPDFGHTGLWEVICNDRFPCAVLVTLYARMGLHRYNILKERKYQLVCVEKYNKTTNLGARSYFITLVAKDPATNLLQTFQTGVDEQALGQFMLTSYITRLREDPKIWPKFPFFGDDLPECPTVNPFRNTKLFRVLTKSELQDNHDWIHLYLELALGTTKMSGLNPDLPTLNIVKVAMDTTEDANGKGLNAKKAIFYIRYTGSCVARVGKDVDRIAIVRRAFDEQTGCFSLVGRKLRSETIPKKRKNRSALRFGVCKPWRLSSHRRHKAFKNSGLGFGLARSRRPHKTRSI